MVCSAITSVLSPVGVSYWTIADSACFVAGGSWLHSTGSGGCELGSGIFFGKKFRKKSIESYMKGWTIK